MLTTLVSYVVIHLILVSLAAALWGFVQRRQRRRGEQQHQPRVIVLGNNDNNNNSQNEQGSHRCTRVPEHLSAKSVALIGQHTAIATSSGSFNSLLVDGLIPFRHGRAVNYEASHDSADQQVLNRKDRARIMARLLERVALLPSQANTPRSVSGAGESTVTSPTPTPPPTKGSTLVVSIPLDQVSCPQLHRVLYLLATYYNLLVVLAMPATSNLDQKAATRPDPAVFEAKQSLRSSSCLPAHVLPDHRITAASTAAGRIALVRQLQRVELVIDFEEQVQEQLSRFGHCVVVLNADSNMPHHGSDPSASSYLGRLLEA